MSDTAWILWSLFEKAWLKHGAYFVLWVLSLFFTLLLSWKYKIRWQKSPYTDTWGLLIAHGNSYFGCSCNLLYVKHYTRFLYTCTVSVIVRSLHMKEKNPAQTLSKVYAFKFIYINWRYIQYYPYILHIPCICLVKNCLWFENFKPV